MRQTRVVQQRGLLLQQLATIAIFRIKAKRHHARSVPHQRIRASFFIGFYSETTPLLLMEAVSKSLERETLRSTKWASSAHDWDLARELDACKESRDSLQRQLGLLAINSDRNAYESLVSQNSINQRRIEIIEIEITRRKHRF